MAAAPAPVPGSDADLAARRRRRSLVLGLVLGGLVLLFYILTLVKLGPSVLDRAL